jgi:hypothetical protein
METIGELVEFLGCFDPSVRLHVLGVSGGPTSELVTMTSMIVADPIVVRSNDRPSDVWLLASRRPIDVAELPASLVVERSACGCLLEVPVVLDRPAATWGIECEHFAAVVVR